MLTELGIRAKEAKKVLMISTTEERNDALAKIAKNLTDNCDVILEANKKDIENAKESGMSESMLDRLTLTKERIEGMAQGVLDVAKLDDPVGKILSSTVRPNGLRIDKVTVPIGVIGVIFEARPNVTSDAAALCLKSANTVILRGGKEAINSNMATVSVMRDALKDTSIPEDAIQLVENTTRDSANALMTMNGYIDVLIPRGGAGLISAVVRNSTVPVIETGVGNCHIYVDKDADVEMAAEIVFNAKTSRPSVCNAAETVIIHKDIAAKALSAIKEKLYEKNVKLYGDDASIVLAPEIEKACEDDYANEYLDYKMAVKIADSFEDAIEHIYKYSTGHSEAIITENKEAADKFLAMIDSSAVYVNASTRFTDGGEFGFGAEIGISTQKLHARGPIGLPELQSYKYKIYGDGQIR